eukprot:COSAG06_NODE_4706_length_4024_cov_2.305478_8_plen_48_part_01
MERITRPKTLKNRIIALLPLCVRSSMVQRLLPSLLLVLAVQLVGALDN